MNNSIPSTYCIGWDVGGWNCDDNGKSRDAIVILDAGRAIIGKPWRGNLRDSINQSSNGFGLTAIESYPSPCKHSATVQALQASYGSLPHDDLDDALTCALIGWLYANDPEALAQPAESVPVSEGWIWVPMDSFPPRPDTH